MSKYKFTLIQRTALWLAYGKKCFYSEGPLEYCDMEIDHLVPEWLLDSPEELAKLMERLGLEDDFEINSYLNWVPVKNRLNRRKGDIGFSESNLRYYLELIRAKQGNIEDELDKLNRQGNNVKILTAIGAQIENGFLSKEEVYRFVEGIKGNTTTSEPIIVSLGLLIEDLGKDDFNIHEVEEITTTIVNRFREDTNSILTITEDDYNGETLTVRLVCWHLDISKINEDIIKPWEITEIAMFSDIYPGEDFKELYNTAIVQTYHNVIHDENDSIFGLAFCPQCGSYELERRKSMDNEHDEVYYLITCLKCGWNDWTQ